MSPLDIRRSVTPILPPLERPLSRRMCGWILWAITAAIVAIAAASMTSSCVGRNEEYQRATTETRALSLALGECRGVSELATGQPYDELLRLYGLTARARAGR